MRLEYYPKVTQRKWAKVIDRSTPQERKLLDTLERLRPDMAPLKISGSGLVTPLRRGGIGSYGSADMNWVRAEIRRVRDRNRLELKQKTEALIGAFI